MTLPLFDHDGNCLSKSKPHEWQQENENLPDDENFLEVLKKCLNALPDNWILTGFIYCCDYSLST